MSNSYYDILDVEPNASREEIRQAYREKVKKYHPDRNDDPNARNMMIMMNKAKKVLLNPTQRQQYDRWRRANNRTSRQHRARQKRNDRDRQRRDKRSQRQEANDESSNNHDHNTQQHKENEQSQQRQENNQKKKRSRTIRRLIEALSYPRRGEEWIKTILIGGVLSLFGIVLVPAILVQGYLIRVLRSAMESDPKAPMFNNWRRLIVDGYKASIIGILYIGVSDVFLSGLVLGVFGPLDGNVSTARIFISFVAFACWLIAAYTLPAAQANFALNESFWTAFHFKTILDIAFTRQYFSAIAIASVVGAFLGFISVILFSVLVGVFVMFYTLVVMYYLFGRGYRSTLEE